MFFDRKQTQRVLIKVNTQWIVTFAKSLTLILGHLESIILEETATVGPENVVRDVY